MRGYDVRVRGDLLEVTVGRREVPSAEDAAAVLRHIEQLVAAHGRPMVWFIDTSAAPPPDARTRRVISEWARSTSMISERHLHAMVVLVAGKATQLALSTVFWVARPEQTVEFTSDEVRAQARVVHWLSTL